MVKKKSKIEEIARRNGLVLCPINNITYSERSRYLLSKAVRSGRYKFPRS